MTQTQLRRIRRLNEMMAIEIEAIEMEAKEPTRLARVVELERRLLRRAADPEQFGGLPLTIATGKSRPYEAVEPWFVVGAPRRAEKGFSPSRSSTEAATRNGDDR